MAMSSDIIFYRYSPENMSEDILRKLFVGREKLLEDLVKEIGNAAENKTPRFYLVVGARGIGKSHFLTLLYYEIEHKFPSLLIPVKLAEEEYSIYRASDLFVRILEEYSKDTSDILSLEEEDEILHAAVEQLKLISRKDGKRFIIFVENLHELFKQLEKEELQKLRSIFQKNDIFSLVATAPLIFPSLSEHDEPFYNFFHIQHLKEFSYHEIRELMQKIAEIENGEGFLEKLEQYEERIHGMVHLTGGSPRLVFLFYDMIIGGEIENIEKAFFKIIDEHTPFFQEIFQMLTGQQRLIFDVLISFGETATPKQISEKSRIKLQSVNTQLRRLEIDGYVISRPMGRHTKYEVRERLFRIWREMRQPFGRKRVSIMLDFLQLWYTTEELKELFKIKFELLEAGEKSVLKELCYYAEIQPPEFKAEALLKLTPKLIYFGELEEAVYEITKLKETAAQTKDKELENKIPLYEGQIFLYEKKFEEALEAFNMTLEENPKHEDALFNKGFALGILGKHEEALDVFNMVLEINPKHENALRNKAVVLLKLEKYNEGLEVAKETLDVATKEHSKIDASLIIIEAYRGLDKKAEATLEIDKIKGKMADQEPDLIRDFIEICLNLALEELKDGNRGNADKFIKKAFENSSKLKTDLIKELTMNFLKAAADSGELQVIKAAVEEILDQQKNELTGLIRPIIKAIEIIETKDLNKYYDLQVEERVIVADIVKKITKSDELVPDEIKNKDCR